MKDFNIGDKVWTVERDAYKERITCPDCCGKKFLTVILGDESRVTIDCAGCAPGFEPPRGFVEFFRGKWYPVPAVVNRKEQSDKGTEYGTDRSYCTKHVYSTPEEAKAAITELLAQEELQRAEQLKTKDHKHRSWAWNVHYHRGEVKRHEKDLAYHKAKLEAAKTHVKEEKK